MNSTTINIVSTLLFAIAVIHTFATKLVEYLAHKQAGRAGVWHLLGKLKVVVVAGARFDGFSILKPSFDQGVINPLYLFLYAVPPILVAVVAFRFL